MKEIVKKQRYRSISTIEGEEQEIKGKEKSEK